METIAKYLKENGINETITIGSMGNEGVGLFSTSGLAPTFYFNNLLTHKGLQVITRYNSYLKAEKVINDIFILLNNLEGFKAEQSPFSIGRDEHNRSEFSVNFIITKEGV